MLDGIKSLGHDVYLVDQRIIQIRDNAMDVSLEENQRYLLDLAKGMREMRCFPRFYGPLTVVKLFPKSPSCGTALYRGGIGHANRLPDDVRKLIREEFPDHAEKVSIAPKPSKEQGGPSFP